jgi:hypothetical protein
VTGVISYALFHHFRSNRPRGHFSRHVPLVLRAARACYPGWKLVIHHDDTLQGDPYEFPLRRLHERGEIELVDCGPSTGIASSALWRLKPLFRPAVDYVICRDLDSVSTLRERAMVDEFIASEKPLHLINDNPGHHPAHCYAFVLAGLCGFRREAFLRSSGLKRWEEFIEYARARGIDLEAYMGDEYTLNGLLHHLVARGMYLQHGVPRDIPGAGSVVIAQRTIAGVDVNLPWSVGCEYLGQSLSPDAVDHALKFYDTLPSSVPFISAEAS